MLKQLDILIGLAVVFTIASLLVTMLTQAIASVFAIRGKTFVRGLEVAFRSLAPDVRNTVLAKLSEAVGAHRLLSDSTLHDDKECLFRKFRKPGGAQQFATAARSGEVLHVLELLVKQGANITAAVAAGNQTARDSAVREIMRLTVGTVVADQHVAEAQEIAKTAADVLDALPKSAAAQNVINAANTALTAAGESVNTVLTKAAALVTDGVKALQDTVTSFETAFNGAMDRAQQRFVYYSRQWTIVFSFIVVLVIQLDTFAVYRALDTDDALRARTVAAAPGVLEKDQEIMEKGAVPPEKIKEACLKKLKDSDAWKAVDQNAQPAVETALKGAGADPEALTAALTAAKKPDGTALELAAAARTTLEAEIHKCWARQTVELYKAAFQNTAALADSSLAIEIKPFKKWWNWWGAEKSSVLGLVASCILLSLGAPFWFNTLKSLASLRPVVAQKLDAAQKAKAGGG